MTTTLKYTVIKNREQYDHYCNLLEELVFSESKDFEMEEEIELLTVLIEKWDSEHIKEKEQDPISLLKYLMDAHKMRNKDLAVVIGVSPGLISDILNHKKGLSKEIIWKLSEHFKISQDILNKPKKVEYQ